MGKEFIKMALSYEWMNEWILELGSFYIMISIYRNFDWTIWSIDSTSMRSGTHFKLSIELLNQTINKDFVGIPTTLSLKLWSENVRTYIFILFIYKISYKIFFYWLIFNINILQIALGLSISVTKLIYRDIIIKDDINISKV